MSNPSLPRASTAGRRHRRAASAPLGTLARALASVALTVGFLLALSHVMSRLG